MALKGKIDDFGIADIFQLIGQQQRSGVLKVQSEDKVAEIIFVNGMISRANPTYMSPKRDPFADYLVQAQLITEETLQKALKKQEESLKGLEEVLLDLRLLSQDQIQVVHDNLIIETLYDVLKWKTGEYEFTIKEVDHDERFGSLMSIEHILLDVLRMIDEEPELSRRIPNYEIVLQRAPSIEEGSAEIKVEEEFGDYEKTVFSLVDGSKTIQDIIYQSLLGRYNTIKSIINLLDAGYIKKISVGRVAPPKVLPRRKLGLEIFYGVLPIIIILLTVGVKWAIKTPSSSEDLNHYSIRKAIAETQLLKIKNALNVYFLEKGKFPESLEELVKAQLIGSKDLNFPPGVEYNYILQEDGSYQLE